MSFKNHHFVCFLLKIKVCKLPKDIHIILSFTMQNNFIPEEKAIVVFTDRSQHKVPISSSHNSGIRDMALILEMTLDFVMRLT